MSSLDRKTLAAFLPNREAIAAFEQMFKAVGVTLPSTVEEANALAAQALAAAQAAWSMVAILADALAQQEGAPAAHPQVDEDDTAPRAHLGTISTQDADQVEITGGIIDGTTIGETVAADAKFKKLSASDQITSTVADGTPPLVITSTSKVANLYVDRAALADVATNATNAGHADTAGSLTNPSSYPADATDLASACALANALKAAATSKGL